MSLLLKSELRVHLASDHAEFVVAKAGLRSLAQRVLALRGPASSVLGEGLAQLAERGTALPRRVVLLMGEDLCYMTTLSGRLSATEATAAARAHFDAALDGAPLRVAVQLAPGGQCWVAVALDEGLLEQWQEQVKAAGLSVGGVRFSLGEDLWSRQGEIEGQDLVVAVLRAWGMSLVAIRGGAVTALRQERCPASDADAVIARIKAFAGQQGINTSAPMPNLNRPVHLIAETEPQFRALETPTAGLRWHLLPLRARLHEETL